MIPSSKKKSYTQLPPGFLDQMQDTLVIKEPVEEIEPVTTSSAAEAVVEKETPAVNIKTVTKLEEAPKTKKNERNGQINICVPPETKIDWKVLFAKNNVNITQGIIFAVEHLRNEIDKGEVLLTVGGVIPKNI